MTWKDFLFVRCGGKDKMKDLIIRKAMESDAMEISKLKRQTLKKINKEYNNIQIEILLDVESKENILKNINKKDMFCLVKLDKILGVVDIDGDRIGGLFIKHNFVGNGFGKKLIEFIEQYALKKNIKKVWLYSTPFAEDFYKKMGYIVKNSGTWILREVKFPEVKLEKDLT